MIVPLTLLLAAALPRAAAAPQDCLWESAQDAPQALVEAQSVVLDGKLYIMGGFFSSGLKGTPRTDVYDPVSNSWTSLADMLTVVTHHTAVVDGQSIWSAGGFFGDNGGFVVDDVQVYDVASDSWSFGPTLPTRRAGGGMVRLGRKLHYFGGFATRNSSVGDHYVLDLDDQAAGWDDTSYAPLPMGRGQLSAVVLNGMIYAIGGQFGHDINPVDLDLVHRYDPLSNAWTQVASLPHPRSHFEAAAFVYNGLIYVAGGRDNQSGGAPEIKSISTYDALSDSWAHHSELPVALIGASVKPIDDLFYVTGGGLTANTPVLAHCRRTVDPVLGSQTRVNAGGPMLSFAEDWCMDSFFPTGLASITPGNPAIAGTSSDPLYYSERTSTSAMGASFAAQLPVSPGDYRINLHFAELEPIAQGARVFDVFLEGIAVLVDYDILGSVGALSADIRGFDVEVQDGFIDLDFVGSVGQPKLSALEVLRLPDDSFGVYCQGAPNSVGSGARLGFVGSTSLAQANCRLVGSGLPPNKLARYAVSGTQASTPFGDGEYCLAPSALFGPIQSTDSSGNLSVDLPTDIIPPGIPWNLQLIYLDNAPFQFNASDALQITFTP